MLQRSIVFAASALLAVLSGAMAQSGMTSCPGTDGVSYVFYETQNNCTEEDRSATYDCRWKSGLNRRVDDIAYGGRIAAYKIQWGTGAWTNWFVPGFNDFDCKFNPTGQSCALPLPAKGLRRAWSYFYDHKHKIIICR